MARIVWTRAALAELDLVRTYIEQFDPAAARRMAARLIEASASLRDFPNRGRPAGGHRELPTIAPYVIRYRVMDNTVYIVGIRHGARS